MDDTENNETMASALFEQLRADIVESVFLPGTKLKVRELSERYQVGSSPVREALSRLVSSSLVSAEDRRGFRVAKADIAAFERLTWTRIGAESLAIKGALELGDVHWEAQLMTAHHLLARVPKPTRLDSPEYRTWNAAHRDFHRSLLSGCNSPWLLEFTDSLYDHSARYRWLSMRVSPEEHGRVSCKEHEGLLDVVLRRDVETATRLLSDHYMETYRICLKALEKGFPK